MIYKYELTDNEETLNATQLEGNMFTEAEETCILSHQKRGIKGFCAGKGRFFVIRGYYIYEELFAKVFANSRAPKRKTPPADSLQGVLL
ncbi:hypothetical protein GCM10027443_25460 [Pontibacter brevis]